MAGAIAASLKKKNVTRPEKTVNTFYTPARYGWGDVARGLHPELARVGQTTFNVEKSKKPYCP